MSFYNLSDIIFPHLGITVKNLPVGISIFGFEIAFYGIIVATAMLVGFFVAEGQAKRFGVDQENVMDFAIIVIILAIIGARAYYVIFHWDSFKDEPLSVFNLRTGGLAIYGGVIVAIATAFVFCRVKKLKIGSFVDVCIPGLVIGQSIGRWANFFNREAFGKYTDNLFAMQMNRTVVGGDYIMTESALRAKYATNPDALEKILEQLSKNVTVDGVTYIQAHPTFFYESMWNLVTFIALVIYAKHKRFAGELLAWYAVAYGVGRFWIEGLRTDQLFFFSTNIPVSQIVAVLMVLGGLAVISYNYFMLIKKGQFLKPAAVREAEAKASGRNEKAGRPERPEKTERAARNERPEKSAKKAKPASKVVIVDDKPGKDAGKKKESKVKILDE